ncbi:TRAP transporter fused permease subunit [Salinicola lusitanus]|uniref:TRAP transporter fused permease subunit n=1 Tax=Salinicola lusitanus TaxID=1949085 RepID=A0ABZ3CT46_9GAMM
MTRGNLTRLANGLMSTGRRRQPQGVFSWLLKCYAAVIALWVIWTTIFSTADVLALTIVFLTLMLVLVFFLIAPNDKPGAETPSPLDWGLVVASAACAIFFIGSIDDLANRISLLTPLTSAQLGFGVLITLLTLEATRRTVGLGLTLIATVFIIYNLAGHLLSGMFRHGYLPLSYFIDVNVYTSDGLFGVPVRVAATYAFLFVMFGTFLDSVRGGDFFFNLAARLTGRSTGGPAKVAVISSALFGTVSGSPTADVVTTGSITIPLMQRLGFSRNLAAGIEVAASTGGSILPPVMGSVAFIMAEYTGIAYSEIIIAALVPALLYYMGVLVQVHLYCKRHGLGQLAAEEVPSWSTVKRGAWLFLIPLAAMVIPLVIGYSPTFVALFGTGAIVICSLFSRRHRLTPKSLLDALATTTFRMVGVTAACAAAGLVIGGITMTGLATKFSSIVMLLAGDSTFMTLFFTAIITIILGMGMPTPSAYILAAVLLGPTLVNTLGLPMMSSHLFILYYAVLSALTPPVAVAAYAASAICGGNPVSIAAQAVRLAIFAFVFPFAIVYNPSITLDGTLLSCGLEIAQAFIATLAIAIATEGYLRQRLSPGVRLLLMAAGLTLLSPSGWPVLGGLIVVAVIVAYQLSGAGARRPATHP